jgi:ribosomal protein S18 acetylase RimI-like enzyme
MWAVSDLRVRPMHADDIDAAMAVSAAAFEIELNDEPSRERWRARLSHPFLVDPEGSFVAELGGEVVGVGQALRRERLWCLSLLTVDPGAQSSGAGRALMQRTLDAKADTDAGLIVSSSDSRALRLYAQAGFRLLPTLEASGGLDRSALPAEHPAIRQAGVDDLDELAAISREIRGAAHTTEIEFALAGGGQMLRFADRGFVVVLPGWNVWLLVARDHEAATALLWIALERVGETSRSTVSWLTGAQDWAVDVLVKAGYKLSTFGALGVRGEPGPLRPFVPSGPFA